MSAQPDPRAHRHPIFARCYARMSPGMERGGMAEYRAELLAGLAGEVIEVGAGNGLNFAHYPPQVTRVLAVEPEPYLRAAARANAEAAAVPIEVVDGVAERLPAADGAFDAAVCTLVLCSVRDQRAAIAEIRRVLRPNGELRFLEHVRAAGPGLRRVQALVDATFWPLLLGGCRTGRDTVAAIAGSAFAVEHRDFAFPETSIPIPAKPHVIGVARPLSDRVDGTHEGERHH